MTRRAGLRGFGRRALFAALIMLATSLLGDARGLGLSEEFYLFPTPDGVAEGLVDAEGIGTMVNNGDGTFTLTLNVWWLPAPSELGRDFYGAWFLSSVMVEDMVLLDWHFIGRLTHDASTMACRLTYTGLFQQFFPRVTEVVITAELNDGDTVTPDSPGKVSGDAREAVDRVLRDYIWDLAATIGRLEDEVADLNAQLEDLDTQLRDLQGRYDQLAGETNALKANFTRLLDNYTSLLADYDALQASYTALQSSYGSLQEDYTSLQGRFTELEDSHSRLQRDYTSLQGSYSSLEQRYTEALGELAQARSLGYALGGATAVSAGFLTVSLVPGLRERVFPFLTRREPGPFDWSKADVASKPGSRRREEGRS